MNKQEIENKIQTIDDQINCLKKEKLELSQNLLKLDLTLKEKFEAWEKNFDATTISDLFALKKYPNTYKLVKEREFDRYNTIKLADSFDEAIYIALDPESHKKALEFYTQAEIDSFTGMVLEMIEHNFDSVKIDW